MTPEAPAMVDDEKRGEEGGGEKREAFAHGSMKCLNDAPAVNIATVSLSLSFSFCCHLSVW